VSELGLRERKKQRTRQAIAEAAFRLFDERGFEDVTVAEVARAADVSEGTVFNYFPTKEDLFYAQMEDFEAMLLEEIRGRPPGEPVSAAFARALLERSGRLAQKERAELIAKAARTIDASPSLRAREREVVERTTRALAALLAEETGARATDAEPLAVAAALTGVQRALTVYVRASILAGRRGPKLAADVRAQSRRAFARLDQGLADYAVKEVSDTL
jgi:AcrR family transcriptional regulator